MLVPGPLRERVRAALDDPDHVAKEIAKRLGRSRSTLYRILGGEVGPKTLRKLLKEFPEQSSDPN